VDNLTIPVGQPDSLTPNVGVRRLMNWPAPDGDYKRGRACPLRDAGSLFRSFAELGLVDTVELGVMPVLLGEGVPLLSPPAMRVALK
jgi:hypothetical protein